LPKAGKTPCHTRRPAGLSLILVPSSSAIDSVIATGPDIIQLPKTGEKEVATDEGADPVQASSPEFNPKPTQSNMNDAGINAAITAKEANARAPDEKADSVKAAPPELNLKLTKPGENDATTKASAVEAKASNQMVTGFPPTPDEFLYVEEDCMKYVHASGPVDIGCNFEAVDELVLSNLTHSSFQYTEYFDLIHDFSNCLDKWLTVDTVQFYQCWVSRSIGSYPKNIFLFPLDYYPADVEDIFEDYWNGI
jgi:hypothetical protein